MKQVYIPGQGQTPANWEPVLRLMEVPKVWACPDLAKVVLVGGTTDTNR